MRNFAGQVLTVFTIGMSLLGSVIGDALEKGGNLDNLISSTHKVVEEAQHPIILPRVENKPILLRPVEPRLHGVLRLGH